MNIGDRVTFKLEWRDSGDENIVFRALEVDPSGDVLVVAELDLPLKPTQWVKGFMIQEPSETPDLRVVIEQVRSNMRAFGFEPGAYAVLESRPGHWYMVIKRGGYLGGKKPCYVALYHGDAEIACHEHENLTAAMIDFEKRVEAAECVS